MGAEVEIRAVVLISSDNSRQGSGRVNRVNSASLAETLSVRKVKDA